MQSRSFRLWDAVRVLNIIGSRYNCMADVDAECAGIVYRMFGLGSGGKKNTVEKRLVIGVVWIL